MNYNVAILGLVEIISAITIGVVILSLTYKVMSWVGDRYYNISEYNLAYSIFTASFILSVGIMVGGVLQPLVSSFRLLNKAGDSFWITLKYLGTGMLYIGIAYSATILIGLISTFLYSRLTPIDEFDEMRKNNIGVSLIISTILITMTILVKDGVMTIIEALVPYPQLPPTL